MLSIANINHNVEHLGFVCIFCLGFQAKLNTYCYTKFFEGVVGYTSLGFPCTQLMGVISYYNAVLPFVVTAFPVLQHFNY